MKPTATLAIAFLVAFLAVGLPYWRLPYSKASLPGYAIAIIFVVSAALRGSCRSSSWQAFLIVGLALPAAVMARVAYETSKDPTSHNLWPLEVILAAAIGFAGSLPGAVVGGLIASAVKRGSAKDGGA